MESSFREFDLASFLYPTTLSRNQQEAAFKQLTLIRAWEPNSLACTAGFHVAQLPPCVSLR